MVFLYFCTFQPWLNVLIKFLYMKLNALLNLFCIMLLLPLMMVLNSCDNEINAHKLPVVETIDIVLINASSIALSGGNIVNDGGYEIIKRGVCWSTEQIPTIKDSITRDDSGTGRFSSRISGLLPNTTYYLRAYATNKRGTSYGSQIIFTTPEGFNSTDSKIIKLTTTDVTYISVYSAISGGEIINDGGNMVIARGVCWSTKEKPTIFDNKTSNGEGLGSFESYVSVLIPNTTYYLRAYATNSLGTSYGNQLSFTTKNTSIISTVTIPSGTFVMGSPADEVSREVDEVSHSVTLSAFQMSKFEITNQQFADFLNGNGVGNDGILSSGNYPTQVLISSGSGSWNWGLIYKENKWVPVDGYENHPVIRVTWYGAKEFARYAGGDLPTEAQWEYACRAGTNTPFNTGLCLSDKDANYWWSVPYNNCTNAVTTPPNTSQPIGSYPANIWGLYDMHGNAAEWCNDWYGGYPTQKQTNPKGPVSGTQRVYRGGHMGGGAMFCRSSKRFGYSPEWGEFFIGFRVVIN